MGGELPGETRQILNPRATVPNPIMADRSIRWWPALVIVALETALLVVVWNVPDLDGGTQTIITLASLLLTCFNLLVWFALFSRVRGKVRFVGPAVVAVVVVLAVLALRIESVSGDIVPKLVWRWSPKQDAALVEQAATASRRIDLSRATPRDFPQFLGPDRNGRLSGIGLARDWGARPPKLLWKRPVGVGWSSCAIVGDYLVTQEQRGDQELVACYELLTGQPCWTHADATRYDSVMAGDGPRATPSISDGRVYALGAKGLLNCLDGATGEVLWARDVVEQAAAAVPMWGKSNSPLVLDGLVVVSTGGPNGRSLQAFDKVSGVLAWEGGDDASSYASPVLATLAGTAQILSVNQQSVTGHDPSSGKVLWSYAWPGLQPKVPQPVPVGPDRLLVCAGYGEGCKLLRLAAGEPWTIQEVWSNKLLKPKFSNVVLHEGHVFGLDDGRSLVCLEVSSGKRKWHSGRSGYGHGQLLLVDDLLLVQAESGEVALVEASAERFHELTRFTALADKTWNCAILSGQRLLVRNDREAACYELPLRK